MTLSLDAALASPNLAGTTSAATGRRCKTRRVLDTVGADTAALILDRLHADGRQTGWTDEALSHALDRGGHYVAPSLLSRHRTRSCICSHHETSTP